MPSFYRQFLASVAMIAMNFSAGPYGDAAIAAMSIVNRVFNFAVSAMIGFGQGFQPVCGFNYGARMYGRVLDAFWFCVKISAVALLAMSILLYGFSSQIIAAFRKEDLEVIAIGTRALKLQSIALPLSSWIIMTNMLLQTIGKGMQASVVAVSRQGMFFLPAVLILPHIFGLLGVQMSQTVSDVLSFSLTVPMAISVLRQLKFQQKNDLPEDMEAVKGDIL